MKTIKTQHDIVGLIDHALLHPTMTDAEIGAGCRLARKLGTAAACVKPYAMPEAVSILRGSDVIACPVVGFPHGANTTQTKVAETEEMARIGGKEIDVVVNVGKVMSEDWCYVGAEIRAVQDACLGNGSILKVIFENDYLSDKHIIKLCEICSEIGVAFIKTSTGFGFTRQSNGMFSYKGATLEHLKLMRKHAADKVQIKASGGIRTLDELLAAVEAGADRIGTSSTQGILQEAVVRGFPAE